MFSLLLAMHLQMAEMWVSTVSNADLIIWTDRFQVVSRGGHDSNERLV